jgi:hypothetical protein
MHGTQSCQEAVHPKAGPNYQTAKSLSIKEQMEGHTKWNVKPVAGPAFAKKSE